MVEKVDMSGNPLNVRSKEPLSYSRSLKLFALWAVGLLLCQICGLVF